MPFMERDTPRGIIKGLLQASKGNSDEKKTANLSTVAQTPSLTTPRNLRSGGSSVPPKSTALKRPVQESLVKTAKRKRSFLTPSETITPRTTIKNLLKAAETETPLQKLSTRAGQAKNASILQNQSVRESFRQPQSSVPDIQFQQLVGSASSRDTSFKKMSGGSDRKAPGQNKTFSTPSETVAPRTTIKTFLMTAQTENPTEKRAAPSRKKGGILQEERKEGDSPKGANPSSDILPEEPEVSEAPPDTGIFEESVESIHEPEIDGPSQNTITCEMSDASDMRHSTDDDFGWSKLRTPTLPNETIVKASPVHLAKPLASSQHKRKLGSGNLKNIREKRSQAGTTSKNTDSKADAVRLPLGLVKGIFNHFSISKVSKDAFDVIQSGSDAFFKQLSSDLTSYCKHAKRKTIEQADVELLMRRQGLVSSKESFHALIEKYLPMEYRQEIIPSAKAGNIVVPKPK